MCLELSHVLSQPKKRIWLSMSLDVIPGSYGHKVFTRCSLISACTANIASVRNAGILHCNFSHCWRHELCSTFTGQRLHTLPSMPVQEIGWQEKKARNLNMITPTNSPQHLRHSHVDGIILYCVNVPKFNMFFLLPSSIRDQTPRRAPSTWQLAPVACFPHGTSGITVTQTILWSKISRHRLQSLPSVFFQPISATLM